MESTLTIVNGKIFNPETESFPVVFHFNGGAKGSMQHYEKVWAAHARTAAPRMMGGGSLEGALLRETVRVHVGTSGKDVALGEMCKAFPQALKYS
jgi:hypothetical protein